MLPDQNTIGFADSQVDPHAGQEFLTVYWFGDIVHAANLQAGNLAPHVIERRKKDDGNVRGSGIRFQPRAGFKARFTWHQHIQQNQVRLPGAAQLAGIGTIAGRQGAEAFRLQNAPDHVEVCRGVVYYEDCWCIHRKTAFAGSHWDYRQ